MSGSRRKPGPLGPFVEGYRAWLVGRGYSPSVAIRSRVTLGHLGRWLERNALAVDQLTAQVVRAFLVEYRSDRGRLPGASVWPLLEYLRADGAVRAEPPAVVAPVERLVGEYREWLLCERGLAPVTVRGSEQLARRFLADAFVEHVDDYLRLRRALAPSPEGAISAGRSSTRCCGGPSAVAATNRRRRTRASWMVAPASRAAGVNGSGRKSRWSDGA